MSTVPAGQPREAHEPKEPVGVDVPLPQGTQGVVALESSSVVPAGQLTQTRSVVAVGRAVCSWPGWQILMDWQFRLVVGVGGASSYCAAVQILQLKHGALSAP